MYELAICDFEIKAVEDDGTFVGKAALYEVKDLNGDIIRRGAAKRSIALNPEVPVLWAHDTREPIGIGTLTETDDGVEIKGKLELEVQKGKDARALMKSRAFRGLSIGFDTIKRQFLEEENGEMTRIIEEMRIGEVSPVTNPAQPGAVITEVKAAGQKTATTFQNIPLAPDARPWNASAAVPRVRRWAAATDTPNTKYRRAFLWWDPDNAEAFGSYKFPVADIVGGQLQIIPNAVRNAAARLANSNLPPVDKPAVRRLIDRYLERIQARRETRAADPAPNYERTLRRVISLGALTAVDIKKSQTQIIDPILVQSARDSLTALVASLDEVKDRGGELDADALTDLDLYGENGAGESELATQAAELAALLAGDAGMKDRDLGDFKELEHKGRALGAELRKIIADKETEDVSRADLIRRGAAGGQIQPGTMNQIVRGDIDCPPLPCLTGIAKGLGVSSSRLRQAAERDGCDFDESQSEDSVLHSLTTGAQDLKAFLEA